MSFNLKRLAEENSKDDKSPKKDSPKKPERKEHKGLPDFLKKDKAVSEKPVVTEFDDSNNGGGHTVSDEIRMISGPELMDVLKDILPMMDKLQGGVGPLGEGDVDLDIDDEELAPDDAVNDSFKGMGGMGGVVKVIKLDHGNAKDIIEKLVNHLGNVRRAERQRLLRQAYADIFRFMRGDFNSRAMAIQKIANVMVDAEAEDFGMLCEAMEGLAEGDIKKADAAAYRVKKAYVQTLPENHSVRVAYTTLSTTDGEPVLFCPKSVGQIGYAVAMEVSKCRDNCIDSQISRDGKVTCAYAHWMKVSKDNFESTQNRFEVVKHSLNENLLTLAGDDRGRKDDDENYEKRLEDSKTRKDGYNREKTIETELDNKKQPNKYFNHKDDTKKRPQDLAAGRKASKVDRIESDSEDNLGKQIMDKGNDPVCDDKSMAQMLEDEHKGLSEKDLDAIEQKLSKFWDNK